MSLFDVNFPLGWGVAGVSLALAAVICLVQSHRLESARSEAETWRKLAETARSEAAFLAKERDTLNASLADREEQIKAIQKARSSLEQQKTEVVRHDEKSRSWAAVSLPDNVRRMLLENGS